MKKAVLFDLDGVLIDSEIRTLNIKKEMFDEYGIPYSDDIFTVLAGSALAKIFTSIYPDYPKPEEFLEEYHRRAYVEADVHYDIMEMENASKLLNYLKSSGYKLALVTAADKGKINQVLEECKWHNLFDTIVSGDEGYPKKPDGTVYKVAMQRLGISASEAVIIEDSSTGLKAAKNAEVKVICRKENRFVVNQSDADYYIDNLIEIETILKELKNEEQSIYKSC